MFWQKAECDLNCTYRFVAFTKITAILRQCAPAVDLMNNETHTQKSALKQMKLKLKDFPTRVCVQVIIPLLLLLIISVTRSKPSKPTGWAQTSFLDFQNIYFRLLDYCWSGPEKNMNSPKDQSLIINSIQFQPSRA